MKNNTSYIVLFLLVAGLLAVSSACKKAPGAETETSEIAVAVSSRAAEETRALTLIEDNIALRDYDIRIDAYFHGTAEPLFSVAKLRYFPAVAYQRWVFVDNMGYNIHYYWPIEGSVHASAGTVSSVDFVGYVPYSATAAIANTGVTVGSYTAEVPTFSATLPVTSGTPNTFDESNQADLQEFMYAYAGDKTKDDNSGTVDMTFQRPFAQVYFYLREAKRNTRINTMTLSGLKTSGIYTHGSGWDTSEGVVANLQKTVNKNIPGELNFNGLIVGPIIVLPQDLTGSKGNLTVNRTYNASTEDITADITTNWEAGYIYSYYLDLGADSGQILVDITIEPWVSQSFENPIDVK